MEENFSFGYWLRRQRLARDMRQAELAQQLGVAAITLRKIEADERRPSLQLIERVAEVFGLAEAERARLLQVARADLSPAALPLPERAAGIDDPTESPQALPSGTVTFLFTDIAGSTRLWEQHPEAMRPALARHDSLLRAAVAGHGGALVKGTGDGILAAFALAEDGLACAIAAQRALRAADWGQLGALSVRMALHSGAAELQDGDYFGPTLNRAARLLAAGHGGQILLSLAAAELLRDHLPATVGLRDLGSHLLKDLTRAEQIFQAVVPDLPADFPPLRTLDARRHNLPAQSTALIGREREVAELCALLRRPELRLVTLTGPGGTGKTRLALQSAAESIEQFPEGVWFVNLAPLSDPNLLLPAIAQTLDVRALGERSLAETLRDALRDQRLLLLLDNFEQIIPAAVELAPLLAAAPGLRLLVTSREALHLSGEQQVAVPPLGLPDMRQAALGQAEPGPALSQYEAVRLFIERARAVRADFMVTNTNAPALAEICVRLDGLPLAIELAAARVRLFTPEALLGRLGQRLQLLTGGPRDQPARQQTLRSAIEWSYALLSPQEQALFRRLGVFVGGWSIAGAAAVGQLDEFAALDLLAALADKSLLREGVGPDGEPRFTMLETIREYAWEQLERAGEAEAARERHAGYYLDLAERVAPELRGPRKQIWCDLLEEEHGNLRAALGQLAAQGNSPGMTRLGIALWRFWWLRGHWRAGRRWIEQALASLPAEPTTIEDTRLRADALGGLVWLLIGMSEFAIAAPLAAESLRLATAARDHAGQAEAWFGLAHVAYGQSDIPRAMAALIEAHAAYIAAGDQSNTAYALNLIGFVSWIQGDLAAAQKCQEEALTIARALGDEDIEAMALSEMGLVAAARQEYAQAEALIAEALAIHRRVGNRHATSSDLIYLGLNAYMRGDYARAAEFQHEAMELRRALGDRRGLWATLANLARIALALGDTAEARRRIQEAQTISRELGYIRGHQADLAITAAICAAEGDFERAATLLGAEELLRELHQLSIEPDEHELYDRTGAQARAALGEEAFAAAWAAGRALSLEQALALGMAGAERGQAPYSREHID